jgi:hypothetical protein
VSYTSLELARLRERRLKADVCRRMPTYDIADICPAADVCRRKHQGGSGCLVSSVIRCRCLLMISKNMNISAEPHILKLQHRRTKKQPLKKTNFKNSGLKTVYVYLCWGRHGARVGLGLVYVYLFSGLVYVYLCWGRRGASVGLGLRKGLLYPLPLR